MIKKLLISACEQEKLVDINIYETEEESITGYITNISDKHFTIKEIDKFGCSDGTTVYAIDKIKNISLDNWYLRNLLIIIKNNSKLNHKSRITIHKKGKELLPYFSSLKENMEIIMLFFEEDNYELGIILDYDENFILFKDIGQDGYELGITCYRTDDLIGLKSRGMGEQKTGLLYKTFKDMGDKY
jgi:hypothetical protein